MKQIEIHNFLNRRELPHVLPEMEDPRLIYQVTYPVNEDEPGSEERNFRVDGREHDYLPRAPLDSAILGSNGLTTIENEQGERLLLWVGLDIDGHNKTNNPQSEATIRHWEKELSKFPWLHVYRSKSGNGLHVVATLAQEHWAYTVKPFAVALAHRIAEETDPSFLDIFDCRGSILFYYAPSPGPQGFEVVSRATVPFHERLESVFESGERVVDDERVAALDPDHERHVEWLQNNGTKSFVAANAGYYAHTSDLARLHSELNLRGEFTTCASGSGDEKQNCCMTPLPGGQWLVVRFGDSEDWQTSKRGDCYCILNKRPTFEEFVESNDVVEYEGKHIIPRTHLPVVEEAWGVKIPDPGRDGIHVKYDRKGVTLTVDSGNVPGWTPVSQRKSIFTIPFPKSPSRKDEVRKAYAENGTDFIYYRQLMPNYWHQFSKSEVVDYFAATGHKRNDIPWKIEGLTPLRLVNKPFQPQQPTPGEWNVSRVQFSINPAASDGPYPLYASILEHCGEGFNEAVAEEEWCQENGIHTGADYLKVWTARLLQFPEERLPGIAFCSKEQDCGKSTFGFSIAVMMTTAGYCNSPAPLLETHNGVLKSVVLWDFDDVDFSGNARKAYGRLLGMMVSPTIGLREMNRDVVNITNTLHFLHSVNDPDKFALQPGDKRWSVAEVQPLDTIIPQQKLVQGLVKEAPFYLRDLLRMKFPEPATRLYLPILETPIKTRLMASRDKPLTESEFDVVRKLIELAKSHQLDDLKTCSELSKLLKVDLDPRKFADQWRRFTPVFDQHGLKYNHRRSNGGRNPSAFSLTNGSAK
jgi:hypothetical protein